MKFQWSITNDYNFFILGLSQHKILNNRLNYNNSFLYFIEILKFNKEYFMYADYSSEVFLNIKFIKRIILKFLDHVIHCIRLNTF